MWMFAAAVVLLLVVAGVISYPLLFHGVEEYAQEALPDAEFSERDALLEALSDLEDSHRAGKLSAEDYARQRKRLELRYIEIVEPGAPEA